MHLDGYNQMDLITGKGPSKRHEIWYFAEGTLGAAESTTSSTDSSISPMAGSAAPSSRTSRSW